MGNERNPGRDAGPSLGNAAGRGDAAGELFCSGEGLVAGSAGDEVEDGYGSSIFPCQVLVSPCSNVAILFHGPCHWGSWQLLSPPCFASPGSFCKPQRPFEYPGSPAAGTAGLGCVPCRAEKCPHPLELLGCSHWAFPAGLPFPRAGCGTRHGPCCTSLWGLSRQLWLCRGAQCATCPPAHSPALPAPLAADPPPAASFWLIGAIIPGLNLCVTGRSGQLEEGSSCRQGVSDRL